MTIDPVLSPSSPATVPAPVAVSEPEKIVSVPPVPVTVPSVELGDLSLDDIEEGRYIRFEHRSKWYTVRPFTSGEYDDATWIQSAVQSATEVMPELADLSRAAPHEWALLMDVQSRAEELALVRALSARDTYLMIRCLCDADGKEMFDPNDPKSIKKWDRVTKPLKDKVQRAIWAYVAAYKELPFELVPSQGPSIV